MRLLQLTQLLVLLALAGCSLVVEGKLDELDGSVGVDVRNPCEGLAENDPCDDGDFCNGPDTCRSGICIATGDAESVNGMQCQVGAPEQICVAGTCQASACGDGVISPDNGEDCDTADAINDGCDDNCQYFCGAEGSDCNPDFACDGLTCNADHFCAAPTVAPGPTVACSLDEAEGFCNGAGQCCAGAECCDVDGECILE